MPDGPRELVLANRIIANEELVDAFGHISVRDGEDANRFLISRSLAPARVSESDLQWLDLDRQRVRGDSRSSYAEVAIHAEIYRARPDVMAVCHSHSPSVIPFSVSQAKLRPISQMGSLLGGEVPVWDIRAEGGSTDMLVRTREQGASLARALGQGTAVLMRGHGSAVVGKRLSDVVHTVYALEGNARMQMQAMALGEVYYLHADEIENMRRVLHEPLSSERVWDWFVSRVS
jgi:ribulose-5-phosphate 4-epimerase/fuculose-1-phosphate aldolase